MVRACTICTPAHGYTFLVYELSALPRALAILVAIYAPDIGRIFADLQLNGGLHGSYNDPERWDSLKFTTGGNFLVCWT